MKNFIELKYYKNSKQEIVFENLDEIEEGDNVVLKGNIITEVIISLIQNQDARDFKLFIPYLSLSNAEYLCCELYNNNYIKCDCFDLKNSSIYQNILPKWNIPQDSAILFLSDEDYNRYFDLINSYYLPIIEKNKTKIYIGKPINIDDKSISIILPELHAEDKSCSYHVENINKVCKGLKEKYGVERIELFVSHCFIHNHFLIQKLTSIFLKVNDKIIENEENHILMNIDKITTTNSTGILEVAEISRLEVVDVIDFFKD